MTTHLRRDVLARFLYQSRSVPLSCTVVVITVDAQQPGLIERRSVSTVRQHNTPECSVQTGKAAQLPLLFQQSGGMGKKSMLSNAEIGKCHFDKCKALCTHRLNFDGSLPRRGLLFLFIGLHTKMLNNDVTESKYKCHQHKTSPDEPAILFFSENVFSQRSTGI